MAGPPTHTAETAYVVGGLYGNSEALATILAMREEEQQRTGRPVLLVFNGDHNWLNADVEILYPYRRDTTGFGGLPSLKSLITSALNSQDRDTMIALAAQLDAANNLGCPLS